MTSGPDPVAILDVARAHAQHLLGSQSELAIEQAPEILAAAPPPAGALLVPGGALRRTRRSPQHHG